MGFDKGSKDQSCGRKFVCDAVSMSRGLVEAYGGLTLDLSW
jgi:hypothetical protein